MDKYRATALHRAASKGNMEVLTYLLSLGTKLRLDPTDSEGNTPLWVADCLLSNAVQHLARECFEPMALKFQSWQLTVWFSFFRHLACDENRSDAAILLAKNGASLDTANLVCYIVIYLIYSVHYYMYLWWCFVILWLYIIVIFSTNSLNNEFNFRKKKPRCKWQTERRRDLVRSCSAQRKDNKTASFKHRL